MKSSKRRAGRRLQFTDAARRAELLSTFERSGMSATDFARRHGIHYTTFCGWRRRQARSTGSPGFVEVQLTESAPATELVIECGNNLRLRLTSEVQIELAARLLQRLQGTC